MTSAHFRLDQVCKVSYSQRTRIKSDLQREKETERDRELNFDPSSRRKTEF